jgi:hypothetical protein
MKRIALISGLLVGALAGEAPAQSTGLSGACEDVNEALRITCRVAAQAAESLPPQIGLLLAGGNPTIGTASAGGLRLGVLPRLSATVKVNAVHARFPDLREGSAGSTSTPAYDELGILAPSLSGTATMGVFSGVGIAPTIGGIGSIDLLGMASWIPLRTLGSHYVRPAAADLSYGGGLRLGLVRESFTMPGASVSVTYHTMDTMEWGEVCPVRVILLASDQEPVFEEGECSSSNRGDLGEFSFDLSGWSTRAVASKHLLGLGVAAGVGYDRFSSDLAAGVRSTEPGEVVPTYSYARIRGVELSQARWSAFVDGSFSILVATFAAEAGWMQGGEAVGGYPGASSEFDPADGTFFGSLGLRVAL